MGKYNQKKLSKRLKVLIIVTIIAAIVLLCELGVLAFFKYRGNETPVADVNTPDATLTEVQDATLPQEQIGETQAASKEDPAPETEATEDTKQTEATTEATAEPTTAPTMPKFEEPEVETLPEEVEAQLPYTIPGTNLVIQKIANYEGAFFEDGSDEDVSDVAMILLHNAGTEAVEYAEIAVEYTTGELQFEASAIPAGGYVTVQEANRKGIMSGSMVDSRASVALLPSESNAEEYISVTDNGDNTLSVTNISDSAIKTARIFYKYYIAGDDLYVGGITYTVKLSDLKPGQTVVVDPSHYLSSSSKVVMVRVYDTDA